MSAAANLHAPRVAIIGGGLAGLAAAVGLGQHGVHVELFEARRQLGGRATSFRDPATGELVDHCQHVALGCCTNYLDFVRRISLGDLLQCHRTLHFIGPDGRRYDLAASRWLPAPMHLLPSLWRLKYLSLRERMGIVRAMRQLIRAPTVDDPSGPTIDQWLRERGQTSRAIELFWTPIIISALSETLDRAAVPPVRKVFAHAFLASCHGYEMHVPRAPLAEFYGSRLQQWLVEHGVIVRIACGVEQIVGDADLGTALPRRAGMPVPFTLTTTTGEQPSFDAVILAVPWRRLGELLSNPLREALPELWEIAEIQSAPITAVHLWYDRPITDLAHAVLPGRTSQWLFNRGQQSPTGGSNDSAASSYYYQVVISASRDVSSQSRDDLLAQVRRELAAIFPAARDEHLLRSKIVTDEHAVFSPVPGIDRLRPPQQTAIANLFLAGDWTATNWPATMESAVRSGYLAAEAALSHLGRPAKLLVPDL